jgi:hypothetical protein
MRFVSGHAFRHAEKSVKMNPPSGAGFVELKFTTGSQA